MKVPQTQGKHLPGSFVFVCYFFSGKTHVFQETFFKALPWETQTLSVYVNWWKTHVLDLKPKIKSV